MDIYRTGFIFKQRYWINTVVVISVKQKTVSLIDVRSAKFGNMERKCAFVCTYQSVQLFLFSVTIKPLGKIDELTSISSQPSRFQRLSGVYPTRNSLALAFTKEAYIIFCPQFTLSAKTHE